MVQWLRMQVLGMEVLGSNYGHDEFIFFQHFLCTFFPPVTALLEYLDPAILHFLGFCFITL